MNGNFDNYSREDHGDSEIGCKSISYRCYRRDRDKKKPGDVSMTMVVVWFDWETDLLYGSP